MTPRTSRPLARANSASRPASAGSQPQRGQPDVDVDDATADAGEGGDVDVASLSTATVTDTWSPRADNASSRRGSSTSLATSRSAPSPAAAMPTASRGVAHVNAS